jgi:hypothetical protein
VRLRSCAALLAWTAPASADAAVLHVPASFPTVAAALNAAAPGDVVQVAAGVFAPAHVDVGLDVTIRGAGLGATVLDGNGATVLDVSASSLVLEDLTVRDGADGIALEGSALALTRVRVEDASDGIDLSDSSLVAVDSEFALNSDDSIDLDDASSLRCTRCKVVGNGDDGIEVRLHDCSGPALLIEVASSRIEGNEEAGIQLIDYPGLTPRSFWFHDLVVASNAQGGITWQCCGDTAEDLDGWPGPEPVLVERATIVGNGGPGVEGGAPGLMEVRDSIVWQNVTDLNGVGGPLGTNLVGVDPLFTTDYRLSLASPAVGAAPGGGDLGAFPWRECSDGYDNDGDGWIDLADSGCPDLDDATELVPTGGGGGGGGGCGLGPELAPLLGALALRRRLRSRRS